MVMIVDEKQGSTMPSFQALTLEEAAEQSGYSKEYLRRLILQKEIEAQKLSRIWLIKQDSLNDYIAKVKQETDGRFGPKNK